MISTTITEGIGVVKITYDFPGHIQDSNITSTVNNGFVIYYPRDEDMEMFLDSYVVLSSSVVTEFSMKGRNYFTIYAIKL